MLGFASTILKPMGLKCGSSPLGRHWLAALSADKEELMLPLIVKVQAARLSLQHQLRKLVRSESGATAIEYGLIAAGIAVAIIAAVFALGGEIKAFFEGVQTQLNTKQPG
jgi:pilus assembly protein Flp/PilA